jgi:hypothetical protein
VSVATTETVEPHLLAELGALGAALLAPEAAVGVVERLRPDDLDREAHRIVYAGVADLLARGEVVDTVTLTGWLADRGDLLDAVGGAQGVYDLTAICPTPGAWPSYVRQVAEAATRRRDRVAYLRAVNRLDAGENPLTVRAGLPAPPVSDAGGLQPLDWPTAWAGAATEPAWLVPGLLQAGRAAALVGPAKSGKSLLALEIAAALATSGRALGADVGPVAVLYVDLENALEDVMSRLRALGYGPGDDLSKLTYLSFPAVAPLDSETGGAALAATARDCGAELVILDTVSRCIAGDENDSRTILDLYRHTVVPLRRDVVALLVLDHLGKDPGRGARGTSAKADMADVLWQVTPRGSHLLALTATHRRQLGYSEHLLLHRRTDPLRHVPADAGAHVENDVVRLARRLDDLNLPPDAGRKVCRAALTDAGDKVANALLEASIRHRKATP